MKTFITWVEVPTSDFDRAVEFYNEAFGLELTSETFGNEKMACFPGGEGALIFHPEYHPSSNGTLASFKVPDTIEQTVARIEQMGGTLVHPKTCIDAEGKGFFAVILDSEGNRVGLHEKTL